MGAEADISWKDRREKALKELCDLGMGLARKLAATGEDAQTIPETERCAEAFEKLARSVRLTFALQARLDREDRRALGEAVSARKAQVREAVKAAIRAAGGRLVERLDREEELDDRLAFEILAGDFLDAPVEAVIARISKRLGLPAEVPPPQGEGNREAVEGVAAQAPGASTPSGGATESLADLLTPDLVACARRVEAQAARPP